MADPYKVDPNGFGTAWVEIKHLEALGSLGIEWNTVEIAEMEHQATTILKGNRKATTLQVVLGLDASDPGQAALREAAVSEWTDDIAFRLAFDSSPDAPSRTWFATVFRYDEVFDESGSVMKVLAEMAINSAVVRG